MTDFYGPYALQPSMVIPSDWLIHDFHTPTYPGTPAYQDPDTGYVMLSCGWAGGGSNVSSELVSDAWNYSDVGIPGPFFNFATPVASVAACVNVDYTNLAQRFEINLWEDPYQTEATTTNSVAIQYYDFADQVWAGWNISDADGVGPGSGSVGPFPCAPGAADVWFRIRFDDNLVAVFETSPDNDIWTEFGRSDAPVPIMFGVFSVTSQQNTGVIGSDRADFATVKDIVISGVLVDSTGGVCPEGSLSFFPDLAVPEPPVLLTADPRNGGAFATWEDAWDGGSALLSYQIVAVPQDGSGGVNVLIPAGVAASSILPLSNDLAYDIVIIAINAQGSSGPSNVLTVTPNAGAPDPEPLSGVGDPGPVRPRIPPPSIRAFDPTTPFAPPFWVGG